MNLPRTFDDLEYQLPAAHAIRFRALRGRMRMAAIHVRYYAGRANGFMQRLAWYVAVAAGVLAYLTVCAWLENDELAAGERVRDRAIAHLARDNSRLRGELHEARANRTRKLIYFIEADSTGEALTKLSQIAMDVASERFALAEAREAK